MEFRADINIMPHKELLDPQGKAVASSLKHLDLDAIQDVRIGKRISITLESESEDEARTKVDLACQKLLANPIMESYEFSLTSLS